MPPPGSTDKTPECISVTARFGCKQEQAETGENTPLAQRDAFPIYLFTPQHLINHKYTGWPPPRTETAPWWKQTIHEKYQPWTRDPSTLVTCVHEAWTEDTIHQGIITSTNQSCCATAVLLLDISV